MGKDKDNMKTTKRVPRSGPTWAEVPSSSLWAAGGRSASVSIIRMEHTTTQGSHLK